VACQLTGIGGLAPVQSNIVTHPIATFCIRSRLSLLPTAPAPYSTTTSTLTAPAMRVPAYLVAEGGGRHEAQRPAAGGGRWARS
jgi:hypothetical protein